MAGNLRARLSRATLSLVLATGLAAPLSAHDFWIDLPSHRATSGAPIQLRLSIGDVGAVEPWETLWRKIVSLRAYGPGGVTDQQGGIMPTTKADPGGALIALTGAGTHVVAFESYQSESDLPAAEFNDYAVHEGLTPALEKRKADGTSETRGRELYSRRAKALVQIGDRPTDDAIRPIGQTLEIVPERNPYALAAGDPLPVRVYYRGAPLVGASVTMERLDAAPAPRKPQRTDMDGRTRFAFEKKGRWKVNVVWTQPINHPRADYDTIFSSLTFGY